MLNKLLICTLIGSLSITATAAEQTEEKKPDPANLTAPNTFAGFHGDNKELTLSLGLAGRIDDFSYLGMLEHKRTYERSEEKGKNDRTRARLFGVKKVDWGIISNMGASIDYIKSAQNTGTDTMALGLIAKVETGYDWLSLFPNLAYVEITPQGIPTLSNPNKGIQANLFASIYMDQKGSYLALAPGYTKTDNIEVKKVDVSYGTPLTKNAKWWGELKATYSNTELGYNEGVQLQDEDKLIQASVYYYF